MSYGNADLDQRITEQIVKDLENGDRPWFEPWSAERAASGIIRSLSHSGKPYQGVNVVLLGMDK
jgi:antirestriction protein ArdC